MSAYLLGIPLALLPVGLGLWAWLRARARRIRVWRDLPGLVDRWVGFDGNVDPERLRLAYLKAVGLITYCASPELDSEKVFDAFDDDTRIVVHDAPSWRDLWGRKVGGLTWAGDDIVEVGSDLSALAHELIHLLEARLGLPENPTHAGWAEGWQGAADAAYRKALAESQG